jgi:glycosyltransferase involved in cell wall biosynthesis
MLIAILMSLQSPWAREAVLRLAEKGHEIHVLDFQKQPSDSYLSGRGDLHADGIARLNEKRVRVHLIPGGVGSRWRYLVYWLRVRKVLQDIGPAVVLTLYGGGSALLAYLSGIRPYVVYVVGSDVLMMTGWRCWLTRPLLTHARMVFANGSFLAQRTCALAPRARVLPLYLGVDVAKFSPGEPKPSPVLVLCTRGFSEVYNNEYLIQALPHLPSCLPPFRIVFSSTGPLLKDAERLADRILEPSLRSGVAFLNGVTEEQLLDNLRRAHVYVSVSRSDGTSRSLLEALACGLFPVLSDIPPNREWIDVTSRNGLLTPLDEPKALAYALAEAIRSSDLRSYAAVVNRRMILERADERNNMSALSDTLESLVCQGHRSGATA